MTTWKKAIFVLIATSLIPLCNPHANADVVYDLGTGEIVGSTTGLNDANPFILGGGTFNTANSAGVSFDLTITPSVRSINSQNTAIGIAGGSAGSGLDNGLTPTGGGTEELEALTFTIGNIAGLAAGETLEFTSVNLRFSQQAEDFFTLNGGPVSATGATVGNFQLPVTGASFTIAAATNPTPPVGGPVQSNFAIGDFEVSVVPSAVPEPSSIVLLGLGLGMFGLRRRR